MIRVIVFFIFLLSSLTPHALAIQYRVGEVLQGTAYNEVLKKWIPRSLSIWVGVDADGSEYLVFQAETAIKDAHSYVNYSEKLRKSLAGKIQKYFEWVEVARKNQADVSKSLGCIGSTIRIEACQKYGWSFAGNQVGFRFVSTGNGAYAQLVVSVIDVENQFIKEDIHLENLEIKKLLQTAETVKESMKKAKEEVKKTKLFK